MAVGVPFAMPRQELRQAIPWRAVSNIGAGSCGEKGLPAGVCGCAVLAVNSVDELWPIKRGRNQNFLFAAILVIRSLRRLQKLESGRVISAGTTAPSGAPVVEPLCWPVAQIGESHRIDPGAMGTSAAE